MKLKMFALSAATLAVLTACQVPNAPLSGSQNAATVAPQSSSKAILIKGAWEDQLYAKLNQLIAEHGKASPNYKAENRPYVVFDWDNTTIINDIGEATFTYQIENLAFKMSPQQFNQAIRKNLPTDNFGAAWNNKDGKPVNIDLIAQDLVKSYTYIYQNYSGMAGKKSLAEIKSTPEYQDFSAKLRYLYEAVGDSFSSDISYPWVTYLYAGFTSDEVMQITAKAIDQGVTDPLKYVVWTSPENLKGKAGQVSVKFKSGLRSVPEMQDLYNKLQENGIEVYVCSASYMDVIMEYATNPKYGYNVPKQNVTAMMLKKDKNGVIQAELDSNYSQTQGKGKTETIKKLIAPKHQNQEPLLVAGDSNGDYAMMTDFPKMQVGVVFNRIRSTDKGIGALAKKAVEQYNSPNAVYYLQGRDENRGVIVPQRETVLLDKQQAELLKK